MHYTAVPDTLLIIYKFLRMKYLRANNKMKNSRISDASQDPMDTSNNGSRQLYSRGIPSICLSGTLPLLSALLNGCPDG